MIRLSAFKAPALILLLVMGISFLPNGVILGMTLCGSSRMETAPGIITSAGNIIVGKEDPEYEDCSWYDIRCHARNGIRYIADKANDFGCKYLDPIYLWPTEWC